MPYLNLDDNFADHPKVDGLTDGAFRLHVAGLCFCAKNLTNGVVPTERIQRLVPRFRTGMLSELEDCNLWLPHPEGREIHDYLDWNKSRDWWEAKRAADAKRKAEWRAAQEAAKAGESHGESR